MKKRNENDNEEKIVVLLNVISKSCKFSFALLENVSNDTINLSDDEKVFLFKGVLHGYNDYGHGRWYGFLLRRLLHERNYKYSTTEILYLIDEMLKNKDYEVLEFLYCNYKNLIPADKENEIIPILVLNKLTVN
jgi:hypothetical protein